jgi:hypothetical protein
MSTTPRVRRRFAPAVLPTPSRRAPRRLVPVAEPLEGRLVLAAGLPTTTPVGAVIGQTLATVVNNTSLGGLSVASTSGFGQALPATFLQVTQGAQSALIKYDAVSGSSFTGLSQPAGDGTFALQSTTTVAQAAYALTPAGPAQPLGAAPFTLNVSAATDTFAPAGFLYVQGRNNEILQYTGKTSAAGVVTFTGCTIAGSFGNLIANPFTDSLNAGSFVVQSPAPTSGQTMVLSTADITVPKDAPFTLPIVSALGFTTPTAGRPGFALLYFSPASPAVVSYTGLAPASGGGYQLTGCRSTTAGTIPALGTSSPSTVITATSAAPITFTFTNNTGQADVYVAVAGQQINPVTKAITTGFLAPQTTNGTPDFTRTWQYTAISNQASVPTFQLFSGANAPGATQTVILPNDPYARLDSVRVVFSVGTPPTIPINAGKPSFPAAGNPSDPNNGITYDFVEFTERSAPNDGVLFINTTQVDQVGIPFTMQTTPADPSKSSGVGVTVSRPAMVNAYTNYLNGQFGTAPTGRAAAAAAAFAALVTPNRLLNPSDAISNPPGAATRPLNGYFDPALAAFFARYAVPGNTFRLQRDGYSFVGRTILNYQPPAYGTAATNNGQALLIAPVNGAPTPMRFAVGQTVTGPGVPAGATIATIAVDAASQVTSLTLSRPLTAQPGTPTYTFQVPNRYVVLQLKQADASWNPIAGGQQYQVYAPFFNTGSGGSYPAALGLTRALPPAPPWIAPASSGLMVFGNLGAFADGAAQAASGQVSGTGATGQILLDIENTIVSAFNRGIANSVPANGDVTSAWDNSASYYPKPNASGTNWSNLYAGFLHNGGVSRTASPSSTVGLAYGFAYDDQGGNDPTLTSTNTTGVAITLNALVNPATARPLRLAVLRAQPLGASGLLAPSFLVTGARPGTRYTVYALQTVNGVTRPVAPAQLATSDDAGRITWLARRTFAFRPSTYRLVVVNPRNTTARLDVPMVL